MKWQCHRGGNKERASKSILACGDAG